jgi:hypothetical protein
MYVAPPYIMESDAEFCQLILYTTQGQICPYYFLLHMSCDCNPLSSIAVIEIASPIY